MERLRRLYPCQLLAHQSFTIRHYCRLQICHTTKWLTCGTTLPTTEVSTTSQRLVLSVSRYYPLRSGSNTKLGWLDEILFGLPIGHTRSYIKNSLSIKQRLQLVGTRYALFGKYLLKHADRSPRVVLIGNSDLDSWMPDREMSTVTIQSLAWSVRTHTNIIMQQKD